MLYSKPEVTRFGTFRHLTQVGYNSSPSDGFTPLGPQSTPPGGGGNPGGGSTIGVTRS